MLLNLNVIKIRTQFSMRKVLVHGCFDLLHYGHLEYFKKAKSYGEYLVVSVTTDRFVNKGPGRPYFPLELRVKMIEALSIVDEVVVSDYLSAVQIIDQIKPSFYVKGSDYKDKSKDVTGKIYAEEEAVRSWGGEIVFVDEPVYSSSALINKFLAPWNDQQKATIQKINELGGIDEINRLLDKINKELKVVVTGELIWDIYKHVKPEGLSSKSPSISARFQQERSYKGGAWAIQSHVSQFCKSTLLTSGVEHSKTRYISEENSQRLFEVTDIKEEESLPRDWPDHNLCIVADFGHGLFFNKNSINSSEFRALNVQTNSSNYGFNLFTKHSDWDYIVLDQRELRLGFQDRSAPIINLAILTHENIEAPVGVTLGPQGSILINKGKEDLCPAFADKIIDTIGAGDAYFALTSLLVKINAPPEICNFLGNVYAGLKTKIIGNMASPTKAQLIKSCEALLK